MAGNAFQGLLESPEVQVHTYEAFMANPLEVLHASAAHLGLPCSMSLFVHSQNNSSLVARIATFRRKPSLERRCVRKSRR